MSSKKSERMKTVRFVLNDLHQGTDAQDHSGSSVHRIHVPAKTKLSALSGILEEQLDIELPAEHILYQMHSEHDPRHDTHNIDAGQDSSSSSSSSNSSSGSGGSSGSSKKGSKKTKRRLLRPGDSVSNGRYQCIDDELIVRISPQIPPLDETKVFGVPIERLAARPMLSTVNVRSSRNWKKLLAREQALSTEQHQQEQVFHLPEVLSLCFDFLDRSGGIDEVGIFRMSGSVRDLKQIARQWNSGIVREFPPVTDPHVVAGLVKQLLRELPEPLCTFELYDRFLEPFAQDMPIERRIVTLRELVHELPRANYITLEHLMALLHKVSQRSATNKMSLENLSIVIGPNILRAPAQHTGDYGDMESASVARHLIGSATDTPRICQCCSMMIEHYSQIFDNQSPYDAELLGLSQLPEGQVITCDASSRESRTRDDVFHGYIPRTYYEPRHSSEEPQTTYAAPNSVRITGESIVCLADGNVSSEQGGAGVVERELPFDSVVQLEDVEDQYLRVDFNVSKSETSCVYVSFNDAQERQSWRDHLEHVLQGYERFKQLSQSDPERYGARLTRDELRALRKKKQRMQRAGSDAVIDEDTRKYIQQLEADLAAERQQRQIVELKMHELEEEIVDLRMQLEVARHRQATFVSRDPISNSSDVDTDHEEDHDSDDDDEDFIFAYESRYDDDDDDRGTVNGNGHEDDNDDDAELDSDSDDSIEFRLTH